MKPKNFSEALEELDHLTGGDLKTKLEGELRDLQDKVERLKPQLEDLKGKVHEETLKAKDKVEGHARENLWTTLGVVGLIFFVIGFVMGWRKSD